MEKRTYRAYTAKDLDRISDQWGLSGEQILSIKATAAVLPFRVNNYVVEDLIRWEDAPADPIFQLTFPQRGMLPEDDFQRMVEIVQSDASPAEVKAAAREVQFRLNPHPAGQQQLNVPRVDGEPIPGMQHKYRETVLFFPSAGQTCHAYCSYCFRWAQFVGVEDLKFANSEALALANYVKLHPEVTDVLITGGDPMIMRTAKLRAIIEPLLAPELEHVRNIRIGSKALAWWPYRFTSDSDADDLLRLFEEVIAAGKQLAFMSHYTHPRELQTEVAQEAVARVRSTGAHIRSQAPLVRHVNDSPDVWAEMWRRQVRLGVIPYYMFVERDTGACNYFEVPLVEAHDIFADAYRQVSGLARTVRGPSMSATPGKVCVQGVTTIRGEKVIALQFLQARDPEWVGKPFFAKYDDQAMWLDQLEPAFGDRRFFFESESWDRMRKHRPLIGKKAGAQGKQAQRMRASM